MMSDNENQEVLLMAIEYMKIQYANLQNPCIALYISRYYHLLSLLNITSNQQKNYARSSRSWLVRHAENPRHSPKMQTQLKEFVALYNPN